MSWRGKPGAHRGRPALAPSMPRPMAAHRSCTVSSSAASISSLRGYHSQGRLAARRKVSTWGVGSRVKQVHELEGGRGCPAGPKRSMAHADTGCIHRVSHPPRPAHPSTHLELVGAGTQAGQQAWLLLAALCRQHLAEGHCSRRCQSSDSCSALHEIRMHQRCTCCRQDACRPA